MTAVLDLADIQGLVLFAYREHRAARFLFLRIDDPQRARAWLRRVGPATRRASPDDAPLRAGHNLALSASGLAALGLSEDALATFSREFRQNMADPERARALGDVGESAPDRWEIGGPANPRTDVLLLLYGRDDLELERCFEEHTSILAQVGGLTVTARIESRRLDGDHEHFGFKDGIAQPRVEGAPQRRTDGEPGALERPVRAGEFLFGYDNEYDQRPVGPSVDAHEDRANVLAALPDVGSRRDLGRNGTYLVLRKIRQHVGTFWSYLEQQATPRRDAEWLASRVVGRRPDGTPLARGIHPEGGEFGFGDDPHGERCPLGAHVRRANPRDSLGDADVSLTAVRRHRLVRRGRVYGPPLANPRSGRDDGDDRGLVFIGINANIARQFEFVQQTWIKSPVFAALHGEEDPLIGQRPEGLGDFTIQRAPVRERLIGLPRFVTVRGGGYFFLPSMRALRFLAGV